MPFTIVNIGCGSMSTNWHGPARRAYADAHEDVAWTACCDVNADKARAHREAFGLARWYTDIDTMLAAEKPDAVCLMAPVELTCRLSCQVLSQGYPLLMEKPPGMTVAEIDQMVAAAGDTPNQPAWNRRYAPLIRQAHEILNETFQPAGIQHVRYDFSRVGRKDPDFSTTAVHGIDTVRLLAGQDYAEVRFHRQPLPHLAEHAANVFMDCVMSGGATAHLNFTPLAGVLYERATVIAADHTLICLLPIWNSYDSPGSLTHLHRGQVVYQASGTELSDGPTGWHEAGFHGENAAFFDVLRAGQRPRWDLAYSRQSVAVMQAYREQVAVWTA